MVVCTTFIGPNTNFPLDFPLCRLCGSAGEMIYKCLLGVAAGGMLAFSFPEAVIHRLQVILCRLSFILLKYDWLIIEVAILQKDCDL